MADIESLTLVLLREIRAEQGEMRREMSDMRIELADMRHELAEIRRERAADRRELDGFRHDLRELGRGFVGLSEVVRLQGQRIEQAIGDLRNKLETTIRIEISGSLGHLEGRVENRVMDEIETLRGDVEALRRAVSRANPPPQPG